MGEMWPNKKSAGCPSLCLRNRYVAFDTMARRGMMTTRKGVTRDYENHLDAGKWGEVDRVYAEQMGGVEAFAPLAPYMN